MSIKTLVAAAAIFLFWSSLLAAEEPSQKLPFIGKRFFNFYGGSGTGEYLAINKNGQFILGGCGVAGCSDSRKGKYKNPLPGDEAQYLIHENKIYRLQDNGEIEKGCTSDGGPCASELYEVK